MASARKGGRSPRHFPASVVLFYARRRATKGSRLRVKLEQATAEIAFLREEPNIKDGRWERSRSRRRPHYVDQVSRVLVGFAVFSQPPISDQIHTFLGRAIRRSQSMPKYAITDKGKQFWCKGFKRWCRRRGIRPRYGAVGEPASIALVERFIRSMKQECTRCLLVPLTT